MEEISYSARARLDTINKKISAIRKIMMDPQYDNSDRQTLLLAEIAKQMAELNYNIEILHEDMENVQHVIGRD
jgi:hypothetical protein